MGFQIARKAKLRPKDPKLSQKERYSMKPILCYTNTKMASSKEIIFIFCEECKWNCFKAIKAIL